jgi:L-lactate dehydrogenase complex protein LldG
MSKNTLFNKLKGMFNSEKEEQQTPNDYNKDNDKEAFTAKVIKTKSIIPEEIRPKVFLKYIEPKKLPAGLDIKFASNFSGKQGRFIYCASIDEMRQQLKDFMEAKNIQKFSIWEDYLRNYLEQKGFDFSKDNRGLENSDAAISLCEGLIAQEGSIMFSAEQNSRRTLDVFPKTHIVLAHKNQLKIDIEHGLEEYKFRYDDALPFLFQLGDNIPKYRNIDNKLIINADGTKDVYVFYSEEPIIFE